MKETNYHKDWQHNRVNFISKLYENDLSFFKGKRVLELGSFNGWIGNWFQKKLGAEVTCVDGRLENTNYIKKYYPDIKRVELSNLDTPEWEWGRYDIIINFGLYYHLQHFHEKHLENCIDNCDLMFFESVIFDSCESTIFMRKEAGRDQSLSGYGGTPSTSYVEDLFKNKGCSFTKYTDSCLNGNGHHYDWQDVHTQVLDQCARRFWVVHPPMA
jgi:hypothetical protein